MDSDKEDEVNNKGESKEEDTSEKGLSTKKLKNSDDENDNDNDDDDVESNKQSVVSNSGSEDNEKDENNNEKSRPYSDRFYCSKTNEIFHDPVVIPDGTSYERSAVIETYEDSSVLYENRALKEVIEETKRMSGDDMRASLIRLQKSVRNSFQNLLDQSVMPSKPFNPLPDVYYCPITLEIMHEPVIDKDGTTYERRAIIKWIKANGKSPTTREDAKIDDLYPNNAIYDLIHDEVEKSDELIHPAILKWKNTQPTEYASSEEEEENNNNNNNYNDVLPTTQEQLAERSRRQRNKNCTAIAILFAIAVIFYFFPQMIIILLIGLVLLRWNNSYN